MDSIYALVAETARRQHGLITRAQALNLGLTDEAIQYHLRTGRWTQVTPGVYRINGTPPSWKGRVLAASLAGGPDAAVSHRSAAALWGLDGFEPPRMVDLTVPWHRRRRVAGALVHESRTYQLMDLRICDGIPVTGPARTVLDVCAVSRNPQIPLRALDDVRRKKLATWDELWRCHDLHARQGMRGLRTYRAVGEKERQGGSRHHLRGAGSAAAGRCRAPRARGPGLGDGRRAPVPARPRLSGPSYRHRVPQ